MRIFGTLYDKCLSWARHRHAPSYLGGMSFIESVFFPIPVDVMLAPMALAQPSKAFRFALIATITSVLGGIAGYALGWFAYDEFIYPLIVEAGYQDKMQHAIDWFEEYGVWVVFLAGFSPIPYKVFTISAGVLQLAILPFILASLVGRGMRFYLVAGLMKWGGPRMEARLRTHIEVLGWGVIGLALLAYLMLR